MAAELITLPFRPVINTRGVLEPGALLDVFQAGTLTRISVFSDSGLSAALSNPVVANSSGVFPSVYWDNAQAVRVRVREADGTVLGDADPYYSDGLTSTDISFIQSGTGATTRTVQAKLRDTVSVLDFGAVIDGTTDATTAFQNAINTGKDVILSPGTMVIGLVTMANNNQRIIGTRACTILHKASTAGNLFTITGASCSLIGFSLNGNRTNQTYAYNNREVLVQGVKAEIRGLRITNAQSMGIGVVGGGIAAVIADNDIETCGDFGIFVNSAGGGTDPAYGLCENNLVQDFGIEGGGGGATPSVGIGVRSVFGGWVITGNRVRQVTARTNEQLGIECWTDSNNMVVVGNYVDMIGHGEFGLSITGTGSLVSGNIVQGTDSFAIEVVDRAATVTGNIMRSPRGIGIAVNLNGAHPEPGDIMSITGNVIENTIKVTGSNAGISVDGDPGVTPIAITISGNTVHGLSHGIVVTSLVTGCTITGNTCWNTGSGQAGILPLGTDMTVSGNTIVRVAAAGTGNGGGIVMGGSGHLISGNRISGNSRIDNAILVNVGATNCVIDGNFITGANANTVFCNATGASIVVKNNVGNVGYALQSGNRAFQNLNTSNGINVSQQMGMGLGVFTVATLPASAVTGTEAYVTDANATTFNSVVAGGGANKVPVTYDGAAWRIG